ncbi:hypothetical protein SDC9_85818 [bioreactor metagenome]|uniref:Uncharacterized protein n=1 Tax=bioreactor metagenome TaxID=1076179 RepID=A0A644ZE74_9ZZZZ
MVLTDYCRAVDLGVKYTCTGGVLVIVERLVTGRIGGGAVVAHVRCRRSGDCNLANIALAGCGRGGRAAGVGKPAVAVNAEGVAQIFVRIFDRNVVIVAYAEARGRINTGCCAVGRQRLHVVKLQRREESSVKLHAVGRRTGGGVNGREGAGAVRRNGEGVAVKGEDAGVLGGACQVVVAVNLKGIAAVVHRKGRRSEAV